MFLCSSCTLVQSILGFVNLFNWVMQNECRSKTCNNNELSTVLELGVVVRNNSRLLVTFLKYIPFARSKPSLSFSLWTEPWFT